MKREILIISVVVVFSLLLMSVADANITIPSNANFDIELQHRLDSSSTVDITEPTAQAPVYVREGASFTVKFTSTLTGTYAISVNGTNVGSGDALLGTNTATATLPSSFGEGFYDLMVTVDGDSDTESNAVVVDNTPPVVTLTWPNGGEVWFGCSEHDITWTATDNMGLPAQAISLYYSTDNGRSWKPISLNEANDGRYSWTIPCESSRQCLVRVDAIDLAGNVGSDASDNVFAIFCVDQIAFQSDRDGDWEIYKMGTGGLGQVNVSRNPADDISPAWSPYGEEIIFASNRDGNWEIYTMGASGLGQVNVSRNLADDISPAWSPDGEEIVFASNRDGNWEIYKMGASGLGQVNVSRNPAADTSPAWWLYCEWIFFQSDRDGNWEIYRMGASGLGQVSVSRNPAADMIDSRVGVTVAYRIFLPIILKSYPAGL